MKGLQAFLGSVFTVLAVSPLAAQAPVLSSIQAPYANLQSQVKMAGTTYGAGTVAYGPAGTPLALGGSNFGSSGTVQFVPYANGVAGSPVSATVTTWTSSILSITVPAGASSGLVTVTVGGATSNGLPFVVMQGTYSASCPVGPPNNQLQIVTSGLASGTTGEAYSETLQATGGTQPYTWAITSGSLPANLSLNAATGVISGTPAGASGPTDLTFKITDSSSPNQTNSAVLNLTVNGSGTPTTIYSYSMAYDGVGNVTSYSDSVNGQWSMTTGSGASGYDTLNRLVAAQATAGPYYSSQAPIQATWSYDSFGNRKTENFNGTPSGSVPIPPSSSVNYSTNNQVTSVNGGSGFTYDASGDVMQDTDNQYLYDADGRVCAAYNMISRDMTGYLYDADGNRVAKGPIMTFSCDTSTNGFGTTGSDNLYILGPSGEQLTEMTLSSGTALYGYTNVSAAGQLIGSYTPGSGSQVALNYQLRDWLGTLRAVTGSDGTAQENCESLPYGNGETCVATTPYLFTGKERDAESGNDYFGARYYGSSMGRFLSPDPSQLYFADLTNPQSFNLYSYVYNNPLSNIDPSGMDACAYDNGDGTARIVNAADGGEVDCPGDGFYITTTQQVNAVGFNQNGDLSVYGADGNLYNPDGSAYDPSQSITVNGNDGSGSYIGLQPISSPDFQYVVTKPGPYNGPSNGPSYSRADICAASALLHKGAATGLDAVGIIPGEGNALKGVQAGAGVVSAGIAVAEPGNNPITKNVALSGTGLGLTAVESAKVFEAGTSAAKAVPIAGNALSIYATYSDLKEMSAYYDECMAGKN